MDSTSSSEESSRSNKYSKDKKSKHKKNIPNDPEQEFNLKESIIRIEKMLGIIQTEIKILQTKEEISEIIKNNV